MGNLFKKADKDHPIYKGGSLVSAGSLRQRKKGTIDDAAAEQQRLGPQSSPDEVQQNGTTGGQAQRTHEE